ncbi:MAG: hypothetical protein JXQ76_02025 [Campylobacterales bacterium]|nr:hypothetical protein [Campylobacterales bacterium]
MKTTKTIALSLLIGMFVAFNNCGGGTCSATTQVLALDAVCTNNVADMDSYIPLQSGDIITREEENTVVNIFHNQDNEKVGCVVSGSASIIRAI